MQYNAADEIFHGRIEAITDPVTFEADSAKQLRLEFEQAVDDYLALCAAVGKEPNKTFTGSFNVRIGSELHRKATLVSTGRGISLNQLVSQAVSQFVAQAE
ncbi:MAG: type II toxin-antitoxin system HicB family antitoxin [Hymenobacter sp.]